MSVHKCVCSREGFPAIYELAFQCECEYQIIKCILSSICSAVCRTPTPEPSNCTPLACVCKLVSGCVPLVVISELMYQIRESMCMC